MLLPGRFKAANDELKFLIGIGQSKSVINNYNYQSLADLELKIFSQFGDDGIIQYLVHNINLKYKTLIEFGIEDYSESNTRFLLQKDNWSGFIMDGSKINISKLKKHSFYWKHDLNSQAVFVTKDNINKLLSEATVDWDGVDLLHIDIDGNDYWIWKEIEINPAIVIMEYNSNFGIERAITIPYMADFYRTNAHYSNLYWGSSLTALYVLAIEKGYEFIGCNSAGNNAYFVRKDKMNDKIRTTTLDAGYVKSKYREARDFKGNLTFSNHKERTEILKGLPVYDIYSNKIIPF
ncbi:MAG: hypothetical protein IMY67_00765 [Bacteroidetes bacterium]|nr:hypothetical protein [Bacteroidota bacterium]